MMALPQPAPDPAPGPEVVPQSAVYVLDPCPGDSCLKLNGIPGTPKYEKTCCEVCAGIGVVPAPGCPNPLWEDTLEHMRRSFTSRERKRIEHEPGLTRMQATFKVWQTRRERARAKLKRGTSERRTNIKARIWKRDSGKCVICDLDLDKYPKFATLGHRVDVVLSGSDSDCNVDLQCKRCNGNIKPYRETLEAYFAWRARFRGEDVAPVEVPVEDTPEPMEEKQTGWFFKLWRGKRGAA